jgi:LysR family glycine cleavage system transcriptional activator
MTARILLPPTGDLAAFEAAARHLSFTRAAEELSLTQSAVSRAVRQLEDRIGVKLFERVRQRVALTPAGALYLVDVRALLEGLGAATHRIMAFAGQATVLNVAVLPTFATRWLMPRLPRFSAAHPELTLNFFTRVDSFDFVQEGFDAAIHYGDPDWPGATCRKLMDEVMAPVASPAYRQSLGLREPRDLLRATLMHQATRAGAWADWFALAGVAPPAVLEGPRFEQFSMVAGAAVAGLGAAILPRGLVEDELAAGKLEILFPPLLTTGKAYWAVAPDAKADKPPVSLFLDWVEKEALTAR